VTYELDVTDEKDGQLKLTLPAEELTEQQAREVASSRTMTAKFDSERDIYVLIADGRTILSYETTRRRREASDAELARFGSMALSGGLPLLLVGWLWNRRKLA
jgi:CRISPR/Cas system CSM-associated protein Csm2 small subunit